MVQKAIRAPRGLPDLPPLCELGLILGLPRRARRSRLACLHATRGAIRLLRLALSAHAAAVFVARREQIRHGAARLTLGSDAHGKIVQVGVARQTRLARSPLIRALVAQASSILLNADATLVVAEAGFGQVAAGGLARFANGTIGRGRGLPGGTEADGTDGSVELGVELGLLDPQHGIAARCRLKTEPQRGRGQNVSGPGHVASDSPLRGVLVASRPQPRKRGRARKSSERDCTCPLAPRIALRRGSASRMEPRSGPEFLVLWGTPHSPRVRHFVQREERCSARRSD